MNPNKVKPPEDFLGKPLKKGQTVVKACSWGRSPVLEKRYISDVKEDGSVYVKADSQSSRATKVQFTNRLLVIEEP